MKKLLLIILLSSSVGPQSLSFAQSDIHKKADTNNKSTTNISSGNITIKDGKGSFMISGGENKKNKLIEIHYYKPKDYKPDFKVILVIPGGGRNGDTYRDTWVAHAEKYDLLVLAPSYSEEHYPGYMIYNTGGMVSEGNSANFNDAEINKNNKEWIFRDFDRIFDAAVTSLGSTEEKYDIFGHSAGGQIVHRLVLFYPEAKINRALAANSGWYTLPDFNEAYPYGLKNSPASENDLKKAFGRELVVFLGNLDNENETRGHLRKTPESMKQGAHRFSRGNFFYEKAKQESERLGIDNNWKKMVVQGIGHSYKEMGAAAARFLYDSEK